MALRVLSGDREESRPWYWTVASTDGDEPRLAIRQYAFFDPLDRHAILGMGSTAVGIGDNGSCACFELMSDSGDSFTVTIRSLAAGAAGEELFVCVEPDSALVLRATPRSAAARFTVNCDLG